MVKDPFSRRQGAEATNTRVDMQPPTLSDREFAELSRVIATELGIKMPDTKRAMIASRLARRVRELALSNYTDYVEYLRHQDHTKAEYERFIDLVTTHKTHFFREPQHFEILTSQVLPDLLRHHPSDAPLCVWSAACSTGEEVYSLAMTLEETLRRLRQAPEYAIWGTDVSSQVLRRAELAVYPIDAAEQIPEELRSRYLLRSRSTEDPRIRIVPELRKRARFSALNFTAPTWGNLSKMDVIFCRNVLIYFERVAQEQIVGRLCDRLNEGGYLFLGHTEGLLGTTQALESLGNCVYRKRALLRSNEERTRQAAASGGRT
jgi:chemotaxis protein methyltransferase CheR